jgi:hypothetical protein
LLAGFYFFPCAEGKKAKKIESKRQKHIEPEERPQLFVTSEEK